MRDTTRPGLGRCTSIRGMNVGGSSIGWFVRISGGCMCGMTNHYLKKHGLRKLHGDEMAAYHENKGAVIHDIPWEHSWDRFVGF